LRPHQALYLGQVFLKIVQVYFYPASVSLRFRQVRIPWEENLFPRHGKDAVPVRPGGVLLQFHQTLEVHEGRWITGT